MNSVKTVDIQDTTYSIHPQHRDNNPKKSQWLISDVDEIRCFNSSHIQGWLLSDVGWGLHFVDNLFSYLGIAVDKTTELVLAKFVFDNNRNNWHGYPANHMENPHDIPSDEVIQLWLNNQVIPIPKIGKIVRGKPCKP